MKVLLQTASQPGSDAVDPNAIPPARKENGDVEGDNHSGDDAIASPSDPAVEPKNPA